MRRFRIARTCPTLSALAFGPILDHFRPKRHRLRASAYRALMQGRFQMWNEVTGGKTAAECASLSSNRCSFHSLPVLFRKNSSISDKLTIPPEIQPGSEGNRRDDAPSGFRGAGGPDQVAGADTPQRSDDRAGCSLCHGSQRRTQPDRRVQPRSHIGRRGASLVCAGGSWCPVRYRRMAARLWRSSVRYSPLPRFPKLPSHW